MAVEIAEKKGVDVLSNAYDSCAYLKVIDEHVFSDPEVAAYRNTNLEFLVEGMYRQGFQTAVMRIAFLPRLLDEKKRLDLKQLYQERELPLLWVSSLSSWDPVSDPHGISILQQCRDEDKQRVLSQAGRLDPELDRVRIEAAMNERGQNAVIHLLQDKVSPKIQHTKDRGEARSNGYVQELPELLFLDGNDVFSASDVEAIHQ